MVKIRYRHPWVKRRGGDFASASSHIIADNSLCRLVERLEGFGYKHRLDVVLAIWEDDVQEISANFEKILPKFRERGRVRVMTRARERVVYCSN